MTKITGVFDTRREAEMAIERLVQEHGLDRGAIAVMPDVAENTVGVEVAGADAKRGEPVDPSGDEAALNGRIAVSLDRVEGDEETIRAAFREFGASAIRDN
jgi:hypothetical protein